MSEIVCTDVTKVWGADARREVVAQDSVSLRVRHEEFRVVIGPSSCGKSTCLLM
jgi:ABC-type sugar transport system ATPase subunit